MKDILRSLSYFNQKSKAKRSDKGRNCLWKTPQSFIPEEVGRVMDTGLKMITSAERDYLVSASPSRPTQSTNEQLSYR